MKKNFLKWLIKIVNKKFGNKKSRFTFAVVNLSFHAVEPNQPECIMYARTARNAMFCVLMTVISNTKTNLSMLLRLDPPYI